MSKGQRRRALLSVYDKRGLVELATGLHKQNVELVSTGGTARALREAGLPVTLVSEVTGFPEILGGRVKTLHPSVHAGLLADQHDPEHLKTLVEHGIEPFHLLVVNLYPFSEVRDKKDQAMKEEGRKSYTPEDISELIEMIDIGGPTMLRAAAKNYRSVIVVVDPDDYTDVLGLVALETLHAEVITQKHRRELARKVFLHTWHYEQPIYSFFSAIRNGDL